MSKIGRKFRKFLGIHEPDPNLCNRQAEFTMHWGEVDGVRQIKLCRDCALICYTASKILGLKNCEFEKMQVLVKSDTCQGFRVQEMGIAPNPAPGQDRTAPLPSNVVGGDKLPGQP